MHRTQISIEDKQYTFLFGEARRLGVSIAELLRRMISERMLEQTDEGDPMDSLVGIAEGDGSAVGREHDSYFYGHRKTDCTSFALMQRLKLCTAVALDADFRTFGLLNA